MKLGGAAITPMVKNIATKLAEHKRGVAILTPSASVAKTWTDVAGYPETTKAVAERVGAMQAGASFGPIVLANRYDGIDLAGDACRFLVMDNLPQGTSNYDVFRMNVVAENPASLCAASGSRQAICHDRRAPARI